MLGPDGEHDYADFRLSPDETRVAASLVNPKMGVPDIWLIDRERGGAQQFTFGPAINVNAAAVWSPDGNQIVFRSNRKSLIAPIRRARALVATTSSYCQMTLQKQRARRRAIWRPRIGPATENTSPLPVAFRPMCGSCLSAAT